MAAKGSPPSTVGKLTLNRNPENYSPEIVKAAFSPTHMVPVIEASADPVLQSRLFSYPDTQRHRLGVNYQQISVNKPLHPKAIYQHDSFMSVGGNYRSVPNYSSPLNAVTIRQQSAPTREHWEGSPNNFMFEATAEDSVQPRVFWEVLRCTAGQQANMIYNISPHLKDVDPRVRKENCMLFGKVNEALGARLRITNSRWWGAKLFYHESVFA